MRIIMLDLDTLRPDHMSCYGYERETTPNLDKIAAEGCRFNHYHCTDAPCLPSRAALITGRFGIHNGIVGHGGTASDLHLYGAERGFRNQELEDGFFNIFRKAGYHTASISSFAERHSAFWFHSGCNEVYNCGMGGTEPAETVMPVILDWIEKNAGKDRWFLHINLWDAHTPYRAPESFGNPFADTPLPAWLTPEVFAEHRRHVGPHSINEINMYDGRPNPGFPRQPGSVSEYEHLRDVIDGYDCGIRYMDEKIGEILALLREKGIYDDVAFIITADHGEDMGELGIYCEHALADEHVTRIPMILKFPGIAKKTDDDFHYHIDLLPTLAEYFGTPFGENWDGKSFYGSLINGESGISGQEGYKPREYLVVSQCAHVCQRSVRFGPWLYMRTYHGGLHLYPKEMLYHIEKDYYEQHDLAEERPDICSQACRYLCEWEDEMMEGSDSDRDPLWTVIREGGPHHCRGYKEQYVKQLMATGREEGAEEVRERYKKFR